MPDPVPFPEHRRAASPSGAEQPAGQASQPAPDVPPSNVVSLDARRPKPAQGPTIYLSLVWWL